MFLNKINEPVFLVSQKSVVKGHIIQVFYKFFLQTNYCAAGNSNNKANFLQYGTFFFENKSAEYEKTGNARAYNNRVSGCSDL